MADPAKDVLMSLKFPDGHVHDQPISEQTARDLIAGKKDRPAPSFTIVMHDGHTYEGISHVSCAPGTHGAQEFAFKTSPEAGPTIVDAEKVKEVRFGAKTAEQQQQQQQQPAQ